MVARKAKRPAPDGKAIAQSILASEDAPEVITGRWFLEEAIRRGDAMELLLWAAGLPRDLEQSARLIDEALDTSLAPSSVKLHGQDEGRPKYLRAKRGWVPTMTASSEDLAHFSAWLAEHERRSTRRGEAGDELARLLQRHAAKTPAQLVRKLDGEARQRVIDLVRHLAVGDEATASQRGQEDISCQ